MSLLRAEGALSYLAFISGRRFENPEELLSPIVRLAASRLIDSLAAGYRLSVSIEVLLLYVPVLSTSLTRVSTKHSMATYCSN